MHIFFEIVLQFLVQAVFQILCALPFDWFFLQQRRDDMQRPKNMQKFTFLVCTILGLSVGALTLVIFKDPFVAHNGFRFLSLFVTPYLVGKFVHFIHDRRTYDPERVYLFDEFWNAYIFSFGISIIRFIFV